MDVLSEVSIPFGVVKGPPEVVEASLAKLTGEVTGMGPAPVAGGLVSGFFSRALRIVDDGSVTVETRKR